ncbi:MAG: TlpA disulfide reductase family protein [Granulosicoccaceae bacterium]|jgi:thiol-disulfide isomerase/thioredoxin
MRLLYLIVCLLSLPAIAADIRTVETAQGEVGYSHYQAQGDRLFIWVAPEAGLQDSEREAAAQLAQDYAIEVWYPDLFEANFLPIVQSSMDRIPAVQLADLLQSATRTDKQVYFVTSGRGAIPVLRGIRLWQQANPESTRLRGAILLSAKLFVETPDPGRAAELMPITSASNLPLFVMQPDKSPWWWKLGTTIPALERGGSHVFVKRLPGVRDRFYYRPDATQQERALARRLPAMLVEAARLLDTQQASRTAVNIQLAEKAAPEGKKERVLQRYHGDPVPPPLDLDNLAGQARSLNDYRGKVVLVNFWATWCPPCVHEMPSMQRLQDGFKDRPFTILAVNMAEDEATINTFLRDRVRVDFPILLDSDGVALRDWGVFAFPTSYVLDKQGRIRYALFGSRDWDTPDVIRIINGVINE